MKSTHPINRTAKKQPLKKYTLKLDGKDTFVYASKNLTEKEAKEDIKNRFDNSKVTNIKAYVPIL